MTTFHILWVSNINFNKYINFLIEILKDALISRKLMLLCINEFDDDLGILKFKTKFICHNAKELR